MIALYIDTTSNYLYSALSIDNKITGEIKEKLDKDLSVFTLDKIRIMLENSNLETKNIEKIIVVNGPGSFTGVRIGVTIAKTWALSLNTKISVTSSLKSMALSSEVASDYKVPIIDARRGFVYAGIYDNNGIPVLNDKYISLEALKCAIENLPGSYSVITNNDIDIDNIELYNPNFSNIFKNNINNEELIPHAVNPVYLKQTEAEEKERIELI